MSHYGADFWCVRSSYREAFMLDFILGYIRLQMSAQRRISKDPSSAGCAGHTLSAKHLCAVFYSALESSQMLHKPHKQFYEIHLFGLLAAARPLSPSVHIRPIRGCV